MEVIDDDQGASGDGQRRAGFDRLLTAVCRSEAGLVLALEASRLARNGRDWHTLLDFCAIMDCLVGDAQQLYDPGHADHWLLLGMLCTATHNMPYRGLLRACSTQGKESGEQLLKMIQAGGHGPTEITDEFEISPVSVPRWVKRTELDVGLHQATAQIRPSAPSWRRCDARSAGCSGAGDPGRRRSLVRSGDRLDSVKP